jgi:hypothetical protein
MMREPYEDTMKRLSEDEKHSTYWSHSAARHTQELERSEERTQQEELAGSMRAEAINNAPIDELNAEIEAAAFEADLLNDMRGTLLNAVSILEDIVDDYIQDETPIRVGSVISIKEQLLWVMDAQEKLRS